MGDNEIGHRISELRKEKGMTLEALAEKIGSTKSYIWGLENKPTIRPSAEKIYQIAVELDTTVEYLLGKSVSDDDNESQVFFRNYQNLNSETKKQLNSILKALRDGS